MKFYNDKKFDFYRIKILKNNLTSICHNDAYICFFKNGEAHNYKNACYINILGLKQFCLNNMSYGYNNDFTKKSWRRFVKLQVFK